MCSVVVCLYLYVYLCFCTNTKYVKKIWSWIQLTTSKSKRYFGFLIILPFFITESFISIYNIVFANSKNVSACLLLKKTIRMKKYSKLLYTNFHVMSELFNLRLDTFKTAVQEKFASFTAHFRNVFSSFRKLNLIL